MTTNANVNASGNVATLGLALRVRDHVGVSRHLNHVIRADSPLHSKLDLSRIPTVPRERLRLLRTPVQERGR